MKWNWITNAVLLFVGLLPVLTGATSNQIDQSGPGLAFVGATVHTVSGQTIPNATLLIRGKLVEDVGTGIEIPDDYCIVKLSPQAKIYPGLIDADSDIGRIEIGSVRGTVDSSEVDDIHPDVMTERSINADSEHIKVTRSNGVLLSNSVPRGGVIAGASALLQHKGWNWQDMVVKSPVGLHVFWPQMTVKTEKPDDPYEELKSPEDQLKERDEKLELLQEAFDESKAYLTAQQDHQKSTFLKVDPRWLAMKPVFDKKIPLIIHAKTVKQIKASLQFTQERNLDFVLAGGADAWRMTSALKSRDISVILEGILGMPHRDWEPYDVTYTNATRLFKAGIRFCISNGGGASNNRNLPYHAAKAVAFGLPKEEAVRSITLSAAEILQVSDRYGSIEKGKEATFIITDGDILDIRSHVIKAFIAGQEIDLDDRHKRLYERYRKR
ncbi:amidohydrolase family protein [candidate division CSSED10-310 bacterium]|uniref:Amidohydrolase family protein n=1 Tax=candidate division CSSED10-310 bacterium TaxID=2855610 RepID=A0ABV6Z124_UNCC1